MISGSLPAPSLRREVSLGRSQSSGVALYFGTFEVDVGGGRATEAACELLKF